MPPPIYDAPVLRSDARRRTGNHDDKVAMRRALIRHIRFLPGIVDFTYPLTDIRIVNGAYPIDWFPIISQPCQQSQMSS